MKGNLRRKIFCKGVELVCCIGNKYLGDTSSEIELKYKLDCYCWQIGVVFKRVVICCRSGEVFSIKW